MDDLVSRQAVQTMINSWTYNFCDPEDEWAAMKEIKDLPSVHPELNEWCHDCKEYDPEKGCCPRWGQVIRTALADAQPEIIQCKDCRYYRPMIDQDNLCVYRNMQVFDDDYCSRAEGEKTSDPIDRKVVQDMLDGCGDCIQNGGDWDCDHVHCHKGQPYREYINQIRWERDLAIQQLKDLGYGLGEKPRANEVRTTMSSPDLIDRQLALDMLSRHERSGGHNYTLFVDIVSECAEIIRDVPSAQPIGENDLIELQDRYGDEVRFVVEDMLSGEEKRWTTLSADKRRLSL